MALPTLTKTWIYNVESELVTYPSGGNTNFGGLDSAMLLVGIKKALTKTTGWVDKDGVAATQNFPWTVAASSDGDTANTSDNWSSYLSLVSNAATPTYKFTASEFAWVVLQNSALPNFQFSIGTGSTSTSSQYVQKHFAYCCWEGGFTLSSPVITAYPTSTDRYQLIGSGTTDYYIIGASSVSSFDAVIHVAMSTDGECTRIIACRNGVVFMFWQIEKAKSPVSGWDYPVICTVRNNESASVVAKGGTSDYVGSAQAVTRISSTVGNKKLYMTAEGYGTGSVATLQYTPGHLTNEYALYPAGLVAATAYPWGKLGDVFDMWFTTLGASPGICLPGSGSRQFVSLGGVVIPWTNKPLTLNA